MTDRNKRTTIYLEPNLHKALRLKAVAISRSVSEIVNNAVRLTLSEDAEDISAFKERGREPLISYEEMLERLKQDGII